jgi:hypothetical protein
LIGIFDDFGNSVTKFPIVLKQNQDFDDADVLVQSNIAKGDIHGRPSQFVNNAVTGQQHQIEASHSNVELYIHGCIAG